MKKENTLKKDLRLFWAKYNWTLPFIPAMIMFMFCLWYFVVNSYRLY